MRPLRKVHVCDRRGQLYTDIAANMEHRMKHHKAELRYSGKFTHKHSAAKKGAGDRKMAS